MHQRYGSCHRNEQYQSIQHDRIGRLTKTKTNGKHGKCTERTEKVAARTTSSSPVSYTHLAAINMVYGGASCGKAVMTSSSSPGVSLKQEGISYLAGAELPCLIVNVMRGGPGLGTIQPSQADYFQAVKGGGHGDYHLIALAPASVQEMADFVALGFDLAFKYRNPAIILADGIIGQMMEKVVLPPFRKRRCV